MAKKIALLIGVGRYGVGLKPLRCPNNGVEAMAAVLSDPAIGGFDQIVDLVNPGVGEMRSRICEVFASATKQDLVLFYFTGHGIKDMTGDFFLTTAQSQLFENGRPNAGTAVEAHFLKREVSNSFAERKVVILDCCFGAAFADGFLAMNDSSVDVEAQLGGKGWCVLTASTSARYALEQEGESLSVYTRYLVEGLKTGGAAPDGQHVISAQHLHEYVAAQVKVAAPAMEPAIFNRQQGYDIVIAKALVDNEQRYRKQVQARIYDGSIGPAGRATLNEWQQRLGLSAKQAAKIEAEMLSPYQKKQKHLAVYAAALAAEKECAYPLQPRAIQDLKSFAATVEFAR
ncbi:MAG: caspase family protein [Phormidesmis sp. RL_2_1]|nr:caspase family protein [Phormidesmis sp. RL_2_1]